MDKYYIGVDIGTTSTKSILFNEFGEVVCKVIKEYPIYSEQPDFKEQDPDEIFEAVKNTMKDLIIQSNISSRDIKFVSFSAMMHSLIAVDSECKPLTKCIIWADNRSKEYVKEYKLNGLGKKLYLKTGTPCHPMSPFYKLLWMKNNEENIYKNAYKFLSIKSYIFYKLFNVYVEDYSIASATGMFNIFTKCWDDEALQLLNINENSLPKAVNTTFILNNICDNYKKELGFENKVDFVIGASDGCLANLGSNAIENGVAAATIGTSGAIRVVFDKPVTDEKERVFCYILSDDKYVVGGAINNGGIVYSWFKENFCEKEDLYAKECKEDVYKLLGKYIEETKAGSNGLIFLPFLAGERAPYWDADLRGAFIGISNNHNKRHMLKALIEGICFDMNEVFDAIKELVEEVKYVYANGGFTRTEEWIKILTDVIDTQIIITKSYESSALGAVMLGKLAIGEVKTLDEFNHSEDFKVYNPREENKQLYKDLSKVYGQAVNSLKSINYSLIGFQK